MLTWRNSSLKILRGVVVAGDRAQEWLLPWWVENYRRHNKFPVTFVNLGLSEEGKKFCLNHGEVVEIPPIPSRSFLVDASTKIEWESVYKGAICPQKRACWHKKPLAMLQSPYLQALWLDLDCQVRADLSPLFRQIQESSSLLICPEPERVQRRLREKKAILEDEVFFNSGVIGFLQGSDLIRQWALSSLEESDQYFGDQNLLSRLIYRHKWPVQALDSLYNWQGSIHEIPAEVKIVHWSGEIGKFLLSVNQNLKNSSNAFLSHVF